MPRIYILTMDEPMFYGPVVNYILRHCGSSVVGVGTVSRPLQGFKGLYYYLRFWGLKAFLYISLKTLWKSLIGKDLPSRQAARLGITCQNFSKPGAIEDFLDHQQVDVVIAFVPFVVKKSLLDKASRFWLNTHCGPLPRYAGVDAPFWCMYHNEPQLAVTIHKMTEDIDKGEILSQNFIANKGSYFSMLFKLFEIAAQKHVELIEQNYSKVHNQPKNLEGFYRGRPSVKDGQRFRKQGKSFI